MSAEPEAPAEEPQETDLVTHQALNVRLELFERGLKSRLEIARREREEADRKAIKEIAQLTVDNAIGELKSDLRTEQRDREIAESSKRLDRSVEWSKRFTCAVAGGAICFILFISLQECSSLHSRITTLELKK
jgi:hypothetical protein